MDRHQDQGPTVGQAWSGTASLKDEGPGRDTQAFTGQSTADATLCASEDVRRKAEKADAALIATAALAGFELVKLADGAWLAQRWGLFKPLATAQDVEPWLARVGVPS